MKSKSAFFFTFLAFLLVVVSSADNPAETAAADDDDDDDDNFTLSVWDGILLAVFAVFVVYWFFIRKTKDPDEDVKPLSFTM